MAPSTKDAIVELLGQGKSSGEIVAMGFKKGTVYGAQRQWRQRKKVETSPSTGDETALTAGNHDPQSINAPLDIECDPEILKLKKEIRKAELQRQLGMTAAPIDMEILVAAARDLGQDRREECDYEVNGLCKFWKWSTVDEIPKGIGEPVSEGKDSWRIRPSPLYCALCVANLQGTLEETPTSGLKSRFNCDCGSKRMVAVSVKCTKCDRETWWGWHPHKS